MFQFLNSNWVWILLIGGMLFMHLGHGGHGGHGGGGGCGGHQHGSHQHSDTGQESDQQTTKRAGTTVGPTQYHDHRSS